MPDQLQVLQVASHTYVGINTTLLPKRKQCLLITKRKLVLFSQLRNIKLSEVTNVKKTNFMPEKMWANSRF